MSKKQETEQTFPSSLMRELSDKEKQETGLDAEELKLPLKEMEELKKKHKSSKGTITEDYNGQSYTTTKKELRSAIKEAKADMAREVLENSELAGEEQAKRANVKVTNKLPPSKGDRYNFEDLDDEKVTVKVKGSDNTQEVFAKTLESIVERNKDNPNDKEVRIKQTKANGKKDIISVELGEIRDALSDHRGDKVAVEVGPEKQKLFAKTLETIVERTEGQDADKKVKVKQSKASGKETTVSVKIGDVRDALNKHNAVKSGVTIELPDPEQEKQEASNQTLLPTGDQKKLDKIKTSMSTSDSINPSSSTTSSYNQSHTTGPRNKDSRSIT